MISKKLINIKVFNWLKNKNTQRIKVVLNMNWTFKNLTHIGSFMENLHILNNTFAINDSFLQIESVNKKCSSEIQNGLFTILCFSSFVDFNFISNFEFANAINLSDKAQKFHFWRTKRRFVLNHVRIIFVKKGFYYIKVLLS